MSPSNNNGGLNGDQPSTTSPPGGTNRHERDLEIESRLTAIETTLEHVATKEDIKGIEALMAQTEAKHTKWLIGILIGCVGVLLSSVATIVIALFRTFIGG